MYGIETPIQAITNGNAAAVLCAKCASSSLLTAFGEDAHVVALSELPVGIKHRICVVRHPVDRFRSFYDMLQQGNLDYWQEFGRPSLDELLVCAEASITLPWCDPHLRPQSVAYAAAIGFRLVPIEHLSAYLVSLGLPVTHENRTQPSRIEQRVRDAIERIYQDDCELYRLALKQYHN